MTKYETIAVFLSTIAILIPIIQWLGGKYIIKPRLDFFLMEMHIYLLIIAALIFESMVFLRLKKNL